MVDRQHRIALGHIFNTSWTTGRGQTRASCKADIGDPRRGRCVHKGVRAVAISLQRLAIGIIAEILTQPDTRRRATEPGISRWVIQWIAVEGGLNIRVGGGIVDNNVVAAT